MLRNNSSAGTVWGSGRVGNRRSAGRPCFLAVAAASAALTSAVGAESLAQPSNAPLERRAADYVRFREDVAAIEATPFKSAETTREAHRRLSAHQSKSLSSGWVAYAALVAADTPGFKAAIEKEMSDAKGPNGLRGRDALFALMAQDPSYVGNLDGADEAASRVLAMTAADVGRIATLGEAFKAQAYAMQKTTWGKSKIPAPSARLDDADAYARGRGAPEAPALPSQTDKGVTQPMLASATETWSADWGAKAAGRGNSEPNAQVIVTRILNLAARYSANGMNDKLVEVYAKNDRADQCLSMASLTLRQCIAATRAPYEEAFCLGEHALNDVAKCVGWVAGAGGS